MKRFKFAIAGNRYDVAVKEKGESLAEVTVNGTPFMVEIKEKQTTPENSLLNRVVPVPASPVARKKTPGVIKSPLPGSIIRVAVSEGQYVKKGETLFVMESMKMENNLKAEEAGTIKSILVEAGQAVMQGDLLMEFKGSEAEEAIAAKQVEEAPKVAVGAGTFSSPLPGSILKLLATKGQTVKSGDVILVMESMKMENNIKADKSGVLEDIHVEVGQSVLQGDALFDIK